jgi:hypothetical protein
VNGRKVHYSIPFKETGLTKRTMHQPKAGLFNCTQIITHLNSVTASYMNAVRLLFAWGMNQTEIEKKKSIEQQTSGVAIRPCSAMPVCLDRALENVVAVRYR